MTRPRSRFINPFVSYSSNVNLFQGNPQINPSFTDALDFGYMTKWNKITFTSSVYFNKTKDYFQFIKIDYFIVIHLNDNFTNTKQIIR